MMKVIFQREIFVIQPQGELSILSSMGMVPPSEVGSTLPSRSCNKQTKKLPLSLTKRVNKTMDCLETFIHTFGEQMYGNDGNVINLHKNNQWSGKTQSQ
jgi:hypothetical protein